MKRALFLLALFPGLLGAQDGADWVYTIRLLRHLALNPLVVEFTAGAPLAAPYHERIIDRFLARHPECRRLWLLDAERRVRLERGAGAVEAPDPRWIEQALAANGPQIGVPQRGADGVYTPIAVPLREAQRTVGVLVALVRADAS